jgi:hypothetical protein
MKNKVVEKYLNNFSLINTQGMDAFALKQSKLLSPISSLVVPSTADTSQSQTCRSVSSFGLLRVVRNWH